ncbi:glycosyltransferase [Desulfolutivibrio sulfoxidireducens]|uniref:glycosyltransferase n=1 Tax=Desulfolutivibrio sulfoxidireducens TaxID=2773299 RepID=UPI00159E3427|nr:glycosyltransferase [Desulfolutivibrio sulfoxidireducens]QLA14845.1 glycosyltransferase [Desulfolutivibrio sulfoxidireducens]
MRAAIVVPVKNEARGLRALAEALCVQARPEDRIVFVDAGSDDATPDILRALAAADPRVTLIEAPGAMPGRGRNLAVALAADAGIIAQIDGGNLPSPGWLEALRRPLEEGRADYVTGAVEVMPVPARIFGRDVDMGAIYGASLFRGPVLRVGELDPEGLGRTSKAAAGGAGVAYLRRMWEAAGGFPEWPRFGADPLFVQKISRSGGRFAFAPGARISWQLGPGLWRIVERHFRHQFSRFRAFAPWPVLVRRSLPASVLAALTCAGLLQPWFFAVAGLAFLAEAARQSRKTLRALAARPVGAGDQARDTRLAARFLVPGIEALAFAARVAATGRGLAYLALSPQKRRQARRVAAYLEGSGPCSTAD